MKSTNVDILVLALASLLGNVGVALTGLGMAIIFIFVWQVAIVCGYDGDFKYAIFIQALALLSIQVRWEALARDEHHVQIGFLSFVIRTLTNLLVINSHLLCTKLMSKSMHLAKFSNILSRLR